MPHWHDWIDNFLQSQSCCSPSLHRVWHGQFSDLSLPNSISPRQRPYHVERTSSRPITEVKQHWAWLVLGWVTAWEHQVLLASLFHFGWLKTFTVHKFINLQVTPAIRAPCALPCSLTPSLSIYQVQNNKINNILPWHKSAICRDETLLFSRQRPYHAEHTSSRPITEVKQHWAWLVLGWVTAWEHWVLLASHFFRIFRKI